MVLRCGEGEGGDGEGGGGRRVGLYGRKGYRMVGRR